MRLGTTARTLRLYEEMGLLQVPRRACNARSYSPQVLKTAWRIVRLRALGVPFAGIERIFVALDPALSMRLDDILEQGARLTAAALEIGAAIEPVTPGRRSPPNRSTRPAPMESHL